MYVQCPLFLFFFGATDRILTTPRPGFPISFLLVGMIYTSTKALQFLSVPVYTIFKNLTIIAIAYGEVFLWGGSVTRMAMGSFSLMVLSSIVAAWADIRSALTGEMGDDSKNAIATLNAGYMWMALNVICTATFTLSLRKVIKKMDFKDWDSTFLSPSPLVSWRVHGAGTVLPSPAMLTTLI